MRHRKIWSNVCDDLLDGFYSVGRAKGDQRDGSVTEARRKQQYKSVDILVDSSLGVQIVQGAWEP